MGMCSDPPAPPDLTPQANAMMQYSKDMKQIADDQLAWSKEQYASNKDLLNRVLDTQLPIMEQNAANAAEDRAFYEKNYRPLEENLIKDFQEYDSLGRREAAAGEAAADVTTAQDAQRENAMRRLEGFGIDPSQTRSQALDAEMRVFEAASQAGAANQARRNVENTGRALRAEALNMGKGYASNVAGAYGTAINAGNSAVGNANQTYSTGSNAMNSAIGNYGQVANGIQGSANITNAGYRNELSAFDSSNAITSALVGGVAGAATSLIAEGGEVIAGATSRFSGGVAAKAAFEAGVRAGKQAKAKRMAIKDPSELAKASQEYKTFVGSEQNQMLAEQDRGFAQGGQVVGPGTGTSDSVPAAIQTPSGPAAARLSDGEYVIPADVVRWKGLEFFEKQIANSKKAISERNPVQTPDGRSGVVPPPSGVDINRGVPRTALPAPTPATPRRIQ